MAYKVFTNGSTLQASELNENLMQQSIATFSNAAARTAAITSPVEGQTTYLLDDDRYDSWSGSAWLPLVSPGAWTAFTPTWSGLTVGNGVYGTSHYALVGKTVHLAIEFTLGSTSAVTGDLRVDVPVQISRKNSGNTGSLTALFTDTGGATVPAFPIASSVANNRFLLRSFATSAGTNPVVVALATPSATVPFTWASTDKIFLAGTYEVA